MNPERLLLPLLATALVAATPAGAQAPVATIAATITVGASGERITGSARIVSQERAVESFSALRVDGPMKVELKASTREMVTVRFDDNLLSMIDVHVVSGKVPTLTISLADRAAFRATDEPVVVVEFKSLSEISLRGSGDVRGDLVRGPVLAVSNAGSSNVKIEALDVDVLRVAIAGSGDFTAAGRAGEQGFSIAGSGDIHAARLIGQTVKVRIAGSGDARVNAAEMLDVSIAGSGDVLYRGSPSIKRRIAGSGEVRRME